MILNVCNIEKYFGEQCVLNELSLEISEPRIIALVAPNGTGKTTLLNIICNIEQSDSGRITIFEKNNNDVSIFQDLTYLQDQTVLYPDLTGQNHLDFIAGIHKVPTEEVTRLTKRLKINHFMNKKVKKYSLGMKQRLLFAMAILPNPKIIILDEPLNGLDPSSVLLVRKILKELHDIGSTILFSSHNLDEIDKLTKDIYFLYDGQLLTIEDVIPERIDYTFVLEDIEKVIDYSRLHSIVFEKISPKKMNLMLNKNELTQFIEFCSRELIIIHDQVTNNKSTENLYFDLYRGDFDDSI